MNIVVAGGGKVGYYLASALRKTNHVSVIEQNPQRAEFIAEMLPDVLVILGDASTLSVLRDAGVVDADVIAAVTGQDEDNLVVCQLAKWYFDVSRTVARVSNPKNAEVFPKLGIDTTVSGTTLITHFVEQELSSSDLHLLMEFRRGNTELVEFRLNGDSPAAGKTVAELPLPADVVLVAILREDGLVVPRGDTLIQYGDSVIALTRSDEVEALRALLAGKVRE